MTNDQVQELRKQTHILAKNEAEGAASAVYVVLMLAGIVVALVWLPLIWPVGLLVFVGPFFPARWAYRRVYRNLTR